MPTTRTRRSRKALAPITNDLVAKFMRWRELEVKRGYGHTPAGILLSHEDECEYQEICDEIHSAFRGPKPRPWDMATPLYRGETPDPARDPNSSWSAAIRYRRQLEQEAAKLGKNHD